MPMFPVIFRTLPVHSDGSPDESRKEGQQIAYGQGETLQEAEDNARAWLSDISPAARIYTKEGAPRRALGPVMANPSDVAPFAGKLRVDAFVIFRESL